MRTPSIFPICLAALFLCGVVSAQCLPPGIEDFELVAPTSTSYGIASPIVLPAGWAHDLAAPNSWRADVGGTGSSSTGPSVDHNPGTSTGIYLYTETSGGSAGVEAIMTVCFDASTLTNPTFEFWYHMWNGTGTVGNMGTLEINQSLDDGLTYTSNLWTLSGDQGDQWNWSGWVTPDTSVANGTVNTDVYLQIKGIRGLTFNSDMAIDDVKWGEPSTISYQENTPEASLDINGSNGSAFAPSIVNQSSYLCGGVADPVTGSFNISTVGAASPFFELVMDTSPLVPTGGGGGILLLGEMLNLNVASAANWTYLNGGASLSFQPIAGFGFPGVNGMNLSLPYSVNAALDVSMQGAFLSATFATGLRLTQATELHVAVLPTLASVPGPTAVSTNVALDVTGGATCWAPGGLPFYGTSYTTVYVAPNGTICFGGGGDTDGSPSLLDATNDDGRVGFWTDLDPSEGGTVTILNPAPGIVRVEWTGVWYNTGGPGVTFAVEVDSNTGAVLIDGLLGLVANPNTTSTLDDQWLGMSPGITMATTDPGAQLFGVGGAGAAALATDMLYEFNDVSVSLVGLPASVVGGLNQVLFTPDGFGNYAWSGF